MGAVAHGYRFDDKFAQRVAQGLGDATVMFFYGRTPLASSVATGSPQVAEVAAMLPDALTDKHLQQGERIGPLSLQAGGRAVYSLIVGGAAEAEVGYASRPAPAAGGFTARVLPGRLARGRASTAAAVDRRSRRAAWRMIGLMFVYFERDRPNKVLRQKLQTVAAGERERLLVTEWRGAYRALADAINQAIDKAVERAAELSPSSKKKANLDEILGPTPDSHVEPYFGFADAGPPQAASRRSHCGAQERLRAQPGGPAATSCRS